MKLQHKKTGDIKELTVFSGKFYLNDIGFARGESIKYNSLTELNEDWEDYREPETFWYITAWGDVKEYSQDQFAIEQKQAIGNYFETKEQAEKVVEKLKAWKLLKDKGFEFEWVDKDTGSIKFVFFNREGKITREMWQDIDLLFGGEE